MSYPMTTVRQYDRTASFVDSQGVTVALTLTIPNEPGEDSDSYAHRHIVTLERYLKALKETDNGTE